MNKQTHGKFFTICTPRKNGEILDSFLTEFGYASFQAEEKEFETRRSVKQVSTNNELLEELSDFCKDNHCQITVIYKNEKNLLVQQTCQNDKVFKPKPYKKELGVYIEPSKTLDDNERNNDSCLSSFLNKAIKRDNKRNKIKKTKKIGVMNLNEEKTIKSNSISSQNQDHGQKSSVIIKNKKKYKYV